MTRRGRLFCTLFVSILTVLFAWSAAPALALGKHDDLVKAELIGEPAAVQPGKPFWVALRLRMKEHWHTYWRNPGDSGIPTEIKWTLPPGFSAGPIVWPAPTRIPVGPLVNFGYDGEAYLLTQITPPADLVAGSKVALKADANWLACEDVCVPGDAKVALTLPTAAADASVLPDRAQSAAFAAARASLPAPLPGSATFSATATSVSLSVPDAPAGTAFFFPTDENLLDHAAAQTAERNGDTLNLALTRSNLNTDIPKGLAGVLEVKDAAGTRHAYTISIGDVGKPSPATVLAAQMPDGGSPSGSGSGASGAAGGASGGDALTWFSAALLALLGGLILNLMPCVFPVLSIKVLALANHSEETPAHMRKHGLAYGAGVLAAFGALAVLLLTLRQAGDAVGWGFQLQSPTVITALAYIMLTMGLSLSGAIHVGASFAGIGDDLTRRAGVSGSFFTGVLAAVVASPCTAPFMGAAIGFALTQPAAVALGVFLSLGLGLALPFVLLTFSPALLKRMPRPGLWMDRLKQALAFPLYATAAWLIWVLSQQVNAAGLFAALAGVVLVAFAVWIIGIAGLSRNTTALAARAVGLAAIAGLAFVLSMVGDNRLGPQAPQAMAQDGRAEPFSQARLDQLLAEGRPVFVNMTAAWCITCLVNERVALSSDAVQAAMKDRGIAYLKGDWTNQNPEMTRILERHGRGGVPLYLLYAGRGEPVVLPQVLTPQSVVQELSRVTVRAAGGTGAGTTGTGSAGADAAPKSVF